MDLTVQDIHNFVNAINAGREAVGLPALSLIEYDDCVPSNQSDCLSAHHLFNTEPLAGCVTSDYVQLAADTSTVVQLANALDADIECGEISIPSSIRTVTDEFDSCKHGSEEWQELRELFVEAGYIEDC